MPSVVMVENDRDLCRTYTAALVGAGHTVEVIGSDTEAIEYLVRHRRSPDVILVDMRWPGSPEIVVLSAVFRLSHLARTKVLVIGHLPQGSQRTVQFVRTDMLLRAPVSPDLLRQAVHTLTAGLDSQVPSGENTPGHTTRVWWEGVEAVFVRWTDQALVFAWEDTTETAVKIPRGAVVRLVHKGVLTIEGDAPAWAGLTPTGFALSPVVTPSTAPPQLAPVAPLERAGCDFQDSSRPSSLGPVHTTPDQSKNRFDRVNAVARLIRKLTGGGSPRRHGDPLNSSSGS